MYRNILNLNFILFIILSIISGIISKVLLNDIYSVEFEILEYINSDGRLLNGNCCSGYKSTGLCRGGNSTCRPYWKVCLTNQQTHIERNVPLILPTERQKDRPQTTPRPSFLKNVLNKIFGAPNVKIKGNVHDHVIAKPIGNTTSSCTIAFWKTKILYANSTFPISMKSVIPKKITDKIKEFQNYKYEELQLNRMLILVEIWHNSISGAIENDKLIYRYIETKNLTIGERVSEEWKYGGKTKKSNSSANGIQFEYKWRIIPSSITDFSINETVQNIPNCPPGWKGDLCDQPICMEGCDTEHGYCEEPGKCQCRFGWAGMNCNYCVTMPGCVHGNCIKPLECRCEDGWTGMFCSTPKCKSGCHPINGYCSVPGECKCRFGWQGENCSECSTLPGCQHGGCDEPLDCNCFDGWEGMFCSTPKCSMGCDDKQGWCRRPNECRCKVGYTGVNCTECVPYPGCENGYCDGTPWTCSCKPGWGGITCSERLNWCDLKENPCQNDGTCISVEKADGNYICQCIVGYGGKHCEKIKN